MHLLEQPNEFLGTSLVMTITTLRTAVIQNHIFKRPADSSLFSISQTKVLLPHELDSQRLMT
jgi:hypothetical protein